MIKSLTGPKPATLPARLTEAQAEAALRAKDVELAAQERELAHQFRVEQLEAERDSWRAAQAAKARETRVAQARTTWAANLAQWRSTWSTLVAKAVPFAPLGSTNAMAVMGQYGWACANLTQIGSSPTDVARMAVAVLFAGALESLSLFLGYYAAKAVERRDSATGLYLGAFATSAVVAGLNYSHYASTTDKVTPLGLVEIPAPTATAVVFALFSFISPILWRVHTRAVNRDKLKAAGQVDSRAVRLSMARKVWHPIRSFRVMWLATWEGVEDPAEAVALYERHRAAKKAEEALELEAGPETPADKPLELEAGDGGTEEPTEPEDDPEAPALPDIARRFPAAWDAYLASVRGGNALGQRALAKEHMNNNRHHAKALMEAARTWEGVTTDGDDAVRPAAQAA